MAKNVVTGNLVCNFVCRARDYNCYKVYDRKTGKEHSLKRFDDGHIEAIARTPSDEESAAIKEFINAEANEFEIYLQAHPELRKYV